MFLCFYVCASDPYHKDDQIESRQHLKGDTIIFQFVMETSLGINVKLPRREQSKKWAKDGGSRTPAIEEGDGRLEL